MYGDSLFQFLKMVVLHFQCLFLQCFLSLAFPCFSSKYLLVNLVVSAQVYEFIKFNQLFFINFNFIINLLVHTFEKMCPLFKGLGYAAILINCFIGFYYNVIIAYCFYYFAYSIRTELPWKVIISIKKYFCLLK